MKKPAIGFCTLVQLSLLAVAYAAPEELIVAGYNVENYLRIDRREGNLHQHNAPKPEKEIEALVHVIKDINPDILGVSEMGSPEDFEDFKKRLADAGLGYKDFEYVQAADPQRHLALASRYPIISRQSITDASYKLNGLDEKVKRGFLDVTIKITDDYTLRLIGAHLKSKLAVPEGEALIRRNEAHLLRQHIAKILAADPSTNLLVYGDFNDTKNEPVFHELVGSRTAPDHLYDLWLRDSLGDRWTHYWKTADIYSRIDYIMVSRALFPEVILEKCSVYRSPYWNDASDHRPVVATIRPVNKK